MANTGFEPFEVASFVNWANKLDLKFDFWLPQYNVLVEIDGEHHYRPVNFRGISDDRAKSRHDYCVEMDNIKNKYCLDNNIELIRIPYWHFTKEYYKETIERIITYHNI